LQSLLERLPPLAEIEEELARQSLIDFTAFTKPDYEVNWHHRVIADYLDRWVAGDIKRLILCMGPRYGKSELASRRLPAFVLGNNPDAQIIACSYGASLAGRMNRDVQRIIDAPAYQRLFPDTRLFAKNIRTVAEGTWLRNSDIFEVVGHNGVYVCAGVGGGITGQGFTHGIIDDVCKSREEAESPVYREAVWEWYTDTFYTRAEKDARILIIMTRWHSEDLVGKLLAKSKEDPQAGQWVMVKLPSLAEPEADRPYDPRPEGEPLWPNKFDAESLATTKSIMGSYGFAGVHQQRPSPIEGGMLKRGWWQFYRAMPGQVDEIVQSWDMAFKDLRQSDFVVGHVWARLGANKYLLDRVHDRLDFPATLSAVRTLSAKWPQAGAKYVEDKANGTAVIAMLRSEIPGLIPVEPEGGKVSRVHAVSPQIEAGNVYLPDPSIAPWVHDFIEECATFPNGAHDDDVDAMSQALFRLTLAAPEDEVMVYDDRVSISRY
jgi:predicted phage terminase large subunit-like protein